MNIEHYKNFIKIADLGNISNAAKTLLIAQPSLSKQIKMLEQEFGAPLLKRNARNVELTPAGEIFYEKARLICELNSSCHDEINSNILGSRGKLRIGLTISYPDPFAEDLLRDFSEQYPDINYDIREASSVQLLNLVKNNIIEIALIRKPLYVNPIFKLFNGIEENFMAVYHKNNPWLPADAESIPVQMLRDVPLSISYGLRERIEQMFNEAGFDTDGGSFSFSFRGEEEQQHNAELRNFIGNVLEQEANEEFVSNDNLNWDPSQGLNIRV